MNKPARILVVEDKRTAALLIEKTLISQGYMVTDVVISGEEAVQKAQEDDPDLILMDIELPGSMDGIEAASKITSQLNIPVVYLTAYSNDETLQRVKMTNPFGFIVKPFKARDLHSTIELALAKHDSERKLVYTNAVQDAARKINRFIPRARTSEALMQAACNYLIETGGCSGACIVLVNEDGTENNTFSSGFDREQIQFSADDPCFKKALIAPDVVVINQKCPECDDCSMWGKTRNGYAVIQRLECGDRIFGVLCTYVPVELHTEETLFSEIADDIGFGMRLIEVEKMRKTAEEELRNARQSFTGIVEISKEGILICSPDGMVLYSNPAALSLLNMTPDELLGNKLNFPLNAETPQEIQITMKSGEPGVAEIHQVDTVWKGRPAFLVTLRDVTERKSLEKQKEDFMNTVSHDLRTPLTSIKESMTLISSGSLGDTTDQQQEFLDISLRNVDRLMRMIDSLLVMARLETGEITLNKECIDIEALIQEVIISFTPHAKAESIELKSKLPENPLYVYADSDKLIEVFNNLVSNSFKFTEKGYIELSAADKGDCVECAVYDTGLGLDTDELDKVFDKFQQFNINHNIKDNGIGLGLSIAKGIVEAHDGKIWVDSKKNKWAKFVFTLPKFTGDVLPH
jgi:signal transduction histidine kinase/CheY-like chemotaxis protein